MTRRSFRRLVPVAAATALTLCVAAPAQGTIVWKKGSDIWMAADNGSGATQIASASALGMTSLTEPHAAHNGDTVVFTGSTNRFNTNQNSTFHCGFNCSGIYRWQAGQSVRLSGAPASSNGIASSFEGNPEVMADGRVIYSFFACSGYVGQFGGYSCEENLNEMAIDGSDRRDFPAVCDDGADDPSPNPANASEVAYNGCDDAANNDALWVTTRSGTDRLIGADDERIDDPSWRSDGQQIVDTETGGDPGLWIVAAVGAPSYRHVLAPPNGVTFSSPRFMGAAQDKVLFSAQDELWTVPTSCTAATCSFPNSATKLTSGGDNSEPAWTSRTLTIPGPPQTGGNGQAGGTGQTGTTTNNQTGGLQNGGGLGEGGTDANRAPALTLSAVRAKLRTALAKGLAVKVTPQRAGTAVVTLKSGKKKVGSGKAKVGASGKATVKARFTKAAKRSLRKRKSLKLTIEVAFTPADGGAVRRAASRLTLKR